MSAPVVPKNLFQHMPARLLQAGFCASFAILFFLGWSLWPLRDEVAVVEHLHAEQSMLVERIQQVDEMLTASALYTITMGSPEHVVRYRWLAAELGWLLKRLELTDDEEVRDAVRQMTVAAQEVKAIERRALELAQTERSSEAIALMGGMDYLAAKQRLTEHRLRVERFLQVQVHDRIEHVRKHLDTGLIVALIGAFILVASWCLTVRLLRRWVADQISASTKLQAEVNERRRTETALRDSHGRLKLALSAARAGIWDEDLTTGRTLWTEETFRLYGLDPAGTPPSYDLWLSKLHPEDRDRIDQAYRDTLDRRLPEFYNEFRVPDPNGGATRWFAARCRITYAADGRPLRVIGLDIDISERRAAEEALAREIAFKELTSAVLRHMASDASLELCLDLLVRGIEALRPGVYGSILLPDHSRRTLSVAAAPGLPADYRAAIDGMSMEMGVASCGEAAAMGKRVIAKDIETHPNWRPFRAAARSAGLAACCSQPIVNSAGGMLGTFALYFSSRRPPDAVDLEALDLGVDLARLAIERYRREEQLRQVQKMEAIGQLTGGVAHDFNNLLAVIIGNLDLIEDEFKDRPDLLESVQMARDAGLRGADLTTRLLVFSRHQPLRPKRLDLNTLIADHARLMTRLLGTDVEISVSAARDLWPVEIDPGQFETALTNLATNARDAMRQGGRLTITTRNVHLDEDHTAAQTDVEAGAYAVVEVTDTGTGMPPEVVARAFDPFFTTKEVGSGTGLGLSMVFGFLKQSGGLARIYSEPGRGTTVRMYLPRAQAVEAELAHERTDSLPRSQGREVVLVVEDDRSIRRLVILQLENLGYLVLEAENGPAALAIIDSAPRIDLILTDIVMPGGLDGAALAAEACSRRPDLKVLFTSGTPQAALRERGHHDPAPPLLTKPYRKHELAEKVHAMLSG